MKSMKTKALISIALLVSMGSVLHVVEGMIPLPNILLPGAKLGFANIVTLIALYLFGGREAFLVVLLRIFLGSLLGGSFLNVGFFLALSGGMCAFGGLVLGKKAHLSIIAVSIIGALFHNTGQVAAAFIYLQIKEIFWYLLILLPFALPAGLCNGYLSGLFLQYWNRFDLMLKPDFRELHW
ncbi:MAG: Gx transporter family protein [Atribacterota bacterium]